MTDVAVVEGGVELYRRARAELERADAIVPHTDADGLSAGAIAYRGVPRPPIVVLLGRGQTPFGPDAPLPDGQVAVLDWGVREVARPGLIVDHHVPEEPGRPDQIVVSGHGEEPEVSTAILMSRIVPEAPRWLAALGGYGDLGSRAFKLPECDGAPRSAIRTLTPLINAPRRLRDGPVETAWRLLVEHDEIGAVTRDARLKDLHEARRICSSEFDRVIRTPPVVGSRCALVRFSSPCQVHPLVATTWARRLAPRPVIAANDDYIPGRVNFAVRGGTEDLRVLLRQALPDETGEFAHGHPAATGGSLDPERFEALLRNLDVPLQAPR
jgi:single-stranded-DNA-specific exonuclease